MFDNNDNNAVYLYSAPIDNLQWPYITRLKKSKISLKVTFKHWIAVKGVIVCFFNFSLCFRLLYAVIDGLERGGEREEVGSNRLKMGRGDRWKNLKVEVKRWLWDRWCQQEGKGGVNYYYNAIIYPKKAYYHPFKVRRVRHDKQSWCCQKCQKVCFVFCVLQEEDHQWRTMCQAPVVGPDTVIGPVYGR